MQKLSFKQASLIILAIVIVFIIVVMIGINLKNENRTKTFEAIDNKQYQKIFEFGGNGAKNSEQFTISGDKFKIIYECNGNPCSADLEAIDRVTRKSQTIFNVNGSTRDETIMYGSGEYYIQVVVSDSFNIIVEDYK